MKDDQTRELEKITAELRTMNKILKELSSAIGALLELFAEPTAEELAEASTADASRYS